MQQQTVHGKLVYSILGPVRAKLPKDSVMDDDVIVTLKEEEYKISWEYKNDTKEAKSTNPTLSLDPAQKISELKIKIIPDIMKYNSAIKNLSFENIKDTEVSCIQKKFKKESDKKTTPQTGQEEVKQPLQVKFIPKLSDRLENAKKILTWKRNGETLDNHSEYLVARNNKWLTSAGFIIEIILPESNVSIIKEVSCINKTERKPITNTAENKVEDKGCNLTIEAGDVEITDSDDEDEDDEYGEVSFSVMLNGNELAGSKYKYTSSPKNLNTPDETADQVIKFKLKKKDHTFEIKVEISDPELKKKCGEKSSLSESIEVEVLEELKSRRKKIKKKKLLNLSRWVQYHHHNIQNFLRDSLTLFLKTASFFYEVALRASLQAN